MQLPLSEEDCAYLPLSLLQSDTLQDTLDLLKEKSTVILRDQPEIAALRHEIEFMSGFEVVEDSLLVGGTGVIDQMYHDKRSRERNKFLSAENIIVFEEFIKKYEKWRRVMYTAMRMVENIAQCSVDERQMSGGSFE